MHSYFGTALFVTINFNPMVGIGGKYFRKGVQDANFVPRAVFWFCNEMYWNVLIFLSCEFIFFTVFRGNRNRNSIADLLMMTPACLAGPAQVHILVCLASIGSVCISQYNAVSIFLDRGLEVTLRLFLSALWGY